MKRVNQIVGALVVMTLAGSHLSSAGAATVQDTKPQQRFWKSGCTYSGNVANTKRPRNAQAGFLHCIKITKGQGRHLRQIYSKAVADGNGAYLWPSGKNCTAYPRLWNNAGYMNGKKFAMNGPKLSCAKWKAEKGFKYTWNIDVYLKTGPLYGTWVFSNGRTAFAADLGVD